jgi:hypothetical protein
LATAISFADQALFFTHDPLETKRWIPKGGITTVVPRQQRASKLIELMVDKKFLFRGVNPLDVFPSQL